MKKLMQKMEIVVAAFGLQTAMFFVGVPAFAIMNEDGGNRAAVEREFSTVGFLADEKAGEEVAMAGDNSGGLMMMETEAKIRSAAAAQSAGACVAIGNGENCEANNNAIGNERSTISELK